MGNCLTLHAPHPFGRSAAFCSHSPSCSSCSSWQSDSHPSSRHSLVGTSSLSRVAPPRRILPFPTPRALAAHYSLGHELGHGELGVTHLCTCLSSGTLYACKSVSKLRRLHHLSDILREVRVLQRLSVACARADAAAADRCAYPVRLHQVIEDDSHVHLIMELCRGGELFYRIANKQHYSEDKSATIIKQLMQTIQLCHRMGIIHRDVKPENILLVEDSDMSPIRLADFGLALEFLPGKTFSTMAGSAYYIAPEMLRGEYAQEIDIWSAGVVLYIMLSGVPPFWGETEDEIFDAIREANLKFTGSVWRTVSFACKDLIEKMLCVDTKMRLTPAQVLEHPWILCHSRAPQAQKPVPYASCRDIKPTNILSQKHLAALAA